jgi:lipopolysaccharide transport system permease protein
MHSRIASRPSNQKEAGSIDPVSRSSDSAVAEPEPTRSVGRRAVGRVGDAFAFRPDRVTVIRPAARWPRLDFRELWHFRELLGRFVWRDVKVRYKQTLIGIAWVILQPFLTMVVFTLIFGKFAKFPNQGQQYPVFVYSGLLLWSTYFQSALVGASTSLVANVPLVTKVYFPRVLLPAAAVLVPIVDFIMASTVLVALMQYYDTPFGQYWYLSPLFVLVAIVTALGTGLLFAAMNVRYRDVPYVIPFIIQTWLFVSSVVFPVASLPLKWQWVLAFNPMNGAITGFRWALIGTPPPDTGQFLVGVASAFTIFIIGLVYFRRSEPKFADTI